MPRFGLNNKFTTYPGKAPELVEILKEASTILENAPGCQMYAVGLDQQENDAVWVMEVWDSAEEHNASLFMDGVSQLIFNARDLILGPPESHKVHVMGGVGL